LDKASLQFKMLMFSQQQNNFQKNHVSYLSFTKQDKKDNFHPVFCFLLQNFKIISIAALLHLN